MAQFLLISVGMNIVASLKSRISITIVESILRGAGYQVAHPRRARGRAGTASSFAPDFLVWNPGGGSARAWPPSRLAGVAVRYRRDVGRYVREQFADELADVAAQWPELYVVLVTEAPDHGRSCFQSIASSAVTDDAAPVPLDLHDEPGLQIRRRDFREHEEVVKLVFPLLGAGRVRVVPRRASLSAVPRLVPVTR